MMKREHILDNAARAAGGAIGLISDVKTQAKTAIQATVDSVATDMDLVPREDFEKLEAMLEQARLEQNDIKERLSKLEALCKKTA